MEWHCSVSEEVRWWAYHSVLSERKCSFIIFLLDRGMVCVRDVDGDDGRTI